MEKIVGYKEEIFEDNNHKGKCWKEFPPYS